MGGAAGQAFPLPDREHLNPLVFAEEIALEIIDRPGMKLFRAKMGTEKGLVIVSGNEADFLAVLFLGHFQA